MPGGIPECALRAPGEPGCRAGLSAGAAQPRSAGGRASDRGDVPLHNEAASNETLSVP
jgi:hypothetical protein